MGFCGQKTFLALCFLWAYYDSFNSKSSFWLKYPPKASQTSQELSKRNVLTFFIQWDFLKGSLSQRAATATLSKWVSINFSNPLTYLFATLPWVQKVFSVRLPSFAHCHNQKVLQLLHSLQCQSKPYVRRNPTLNQVEIKGLTYRLLYSFELLFGRAQRDKLVRTFDFDGR